MRGKIPGADVREIRTALRLTVSQFAAVLGVHPSSVHRWEAADTGSAEIEGIAWTVLTALRKRVLAERSGRRAAAKQGELITNELALGGALAALLVLLLFAAGRDE